MPHSVSPEPSEDVAMADVVEDFSEKPHSDPVELTPPAPDAVNDSSDRENRKSLEDMFDDDSDGDDEFPSSTPPTHADDNSQQETLVASYVSI
jgi:hypothetical protein